jgi:hypothetical protein
VAVTQAQIDALKAARNSGALRVSYEGKSTEYRSLADMDAIISDMEGELATTTTAVPRVRQLYVTTDKGF